MRYSFDASVALCWVVPRAHSGKALRLRADYQRAVHDLIAPSHFPAEVASALTKSERQGVIPAGQALPLLDDVVNDLPVLYPYAPLLRRATEISSRYRAGLYDCLYVALAERENCELITADDKLVRNLQPHFPFIIPLSALP
jgi:predicted nucleic acid-binding protein